MDPTDPGRPVITILLVDDDDATLHLVSTFLRRNRFRVIAASNPIRALEILRDEPTIRLIVTDLMMPHVDGIAFTEQVHALPGFAQVPVIMLTAYGSDEVTDRSMRSGVAMTLHKPVQLSRLLDLVGFATAEPPGA